MNSTYSLSRERLVDAAKAYRRSSAQLLVVLQYDLAAFACLMSNDPKCVRDANCAQAHRTTVLAQRARADLDHMERTAAQVDREGQGKGGNGGEEDQNVSYMFTSMRIMHACLQDQFVQHRVRDSGSRPPVLIRGTRLCELVH